MKKSIMALAAIALVTTAAQAQTVSAGYNFYNGESNAIAQGFTVNVGGEVAPTVFVDGVTTFIRPNGVGAASTTIELGATKTFALADKTSARIRGALGRRYISSDAYSYYSISPVVAYQLTDKIELSGGYKFRDSFTASAPFQTNSALAAVSYAVTPTKSLELSAERSGGDVRFNAISLTYQAKF